MSTNDFKVHQLLRGRSNVYLVETKTVSILVDTGKVSKISVLLKKLNEILPEGRLDYLVLTHTHFDHCQNAALIKRRYGCKIIISETEAQYAEQGYSPLPAGTNLLTKLVSVASGVMPKKKFGYVPFKADVLVENDYLFPENREIRLISTPGHSIGSISLILKKDIAIVGDAMFGVFKNSVFPPYTDDVPEMINSWEKLLYTSCKEFLPGHGNPINHQLLQSEFDNYKHRITSR